KELAVEWVPTAAILNLDDPEVRITLDSARNIGVGFGLRHEIAAECAQPSEPAFEVSGLSQDATASLELVDLEQYRPAFSLAAPAQCGRHRGGGAAAQMDLPPQLGRRPVVRQVGSVAAEGAVGGIKRVLQRNGLARLGSPRGFRGRQVERTGRPAGSIAIAAVL